MSDRRLEQVRARLVGLLRRDPPPRVSGLELDWLLSRLSREEVDVVLQAAREYGDDEMSEWLGEILLEAGLARRRAPVVA